MSALDDLKEIDLEKITPLEAAIVFLSNKHEGDAALAAAELLALRERVEKMAVILQWIYDDGEGGTYRPDIQAVLVSHNQSQ